MHANTIDIDEARVLRMKYNLAALVPISIAWTHQKLARDRERSRTCNPVSLLHVFLAADERG